MMMPGLITSGQTKPPPGFMINDGRPDPIWRGLVGAWFFNEGAGERVMDVSGHGNHGTLTNFDHTASSGWAPGRFGTGLSFDGSNDRINCGAVLHNLAPVSYVMWLYMTRNALTYLVTKGHPTSFTTSRYISYIVTGAIEFGVIGSTNLKTFVGYNIFPLDRWYHLVVTWDGSLSSSQGVEIYLDGRRRSHTTDQDGVSLNNDSAHNYLIGSRGDAFFPFGGRMDHLLIFNRVLSAHEVQQLYANPFPVRERRLWVAQSAPPSGVVKDMIGLGIIPFAR